MAKSTNLAIVNKVIGNLGLAPIATLSGITGRELMAFNKVNEALRDIYTEYEGKWKFAEAYGTLTLSSTATGYAQPADMATEDIYSFRSEDAENNIEYFDPQEFDLKYKKITETGLPQKFTRYADRFYFNSLVGSAENGKNILYRYWKFPTQFTTANNTSTCDIPELYEDAVLVNMATFKILSYEGDAEQQRYAGEVWGAGAKEGAVQKMARQYKSVKLGSIRFTYPL